MLNKMMSASDISFILNKFNLSDDKVTIIGCPQHLCKNIIRSEEKFKTYICFHKLHWFVIVYEKKYKNVITLDSFGKNIPNSYKRVLLDMDPKINFYYYKKSIQTDGFTCGLFAIVFVLFVFYFYKNNIINLTKDVNNIKKKDVLTIFNNINKSIYNKNK